MKSIRFLIAIFAAILLFSFPFYAESSEKLTDDTYLKNTVIARSIPITSPSVTKSLRIVPIFQMSIGTSQDHIALLSSAGIAEHDYFYADFIVMMEGHYDPCVVNGGAHDCTYSGNKAYGACQALPGNKIASAGRDWQTNIVTQLKWCDSYAQAMGGWQKAHQKWLMKHYW